MKHSRVLIFHTSRRGDPGENRDWQPTQGKKETFSDYCEGMCQKWTLYYGSYHVVEGNGAPPYICFFQGGAMAIKFHSCSPSLAEDPKNHKLNARIRKGPAGFCPPSGRFVITLWDWRFIPEGPHLLPPLVSKTCDTSNSSEEIQISDLWMEWSESFWWATGTTVQQTHVGGGGWGISYE